MFLLALAAAAAVPQLAAAAAEKKKGGGLTFLQLPALTSYVVRPDGRRGVLTVEAGLDIPDGGLHAYAETAGPRLRAAYVQILQTYASGLPAGRPPNPDAIGAQMQRETDRLLGRTGARVLLGTIMVN
ncbi:MAG: hypothetical protein ABW042_09530 [Phenylobacterium sp.]